MGDKSEILDALSKWSTSTVLAVALGAIVWMDHSEDNKWNARIGAMLQRQVVAQERQEENSRNLAAALLRLLERHQ